MMTSTREAQDADGQSLYPARFWVEIALVAVVWVGAVLWLHSHNPRLLPSWHGFLHSGIAAAFASGFAMPPENPFFAGEPLPYYWVYQYLGYVLSHLLSTDFLHAFRFITLASLTALVVASGLIGRKCHGSILAGILIGYLAVSGLNPLGPVIAAGKHVVKGTPIVNTLNGAAIVESVFVDNQLADDLMTHPLLSALYIGSDWRHGQNLAWFLGISSRTPALALTIVSLFFLLGAHLQRWRCACAILTSAMTTAMNPLIGLTVAGSLFGASALVLIGTRISARRSPSEWLSALGSSQFVIPTLFLAGSLAAAPTYIHLFLLNQGATGFSSTGGAILKAAACTANFLVLAPLAVLGAWRVRSQFSIEIRTMAIAGVVLLGAVVVFHLEEGNEHNLANAAQCLLAVPAASCLFLRPGSWFKRAPHSTLTFGILIAIFLPTSVATLWSFQGMPKIPLAFQDGELQRVPTQGVLESFYSWAREKTPQNAVFVADPSEPVKMSGNVSELPAFTSRSLFVDGESYLTTPYADASARTQIAKRLLNGDALGDNDDDYLRKLNRPLYLVTYHADRLTSTDLLVVQHGGAVFQKEFVAVFALQPTDFEGHEK